MKKPQLSEMTKTTNKLIENIFDELNKTKETLIVTGVDVNTRTITVGGGPIYVPARQLEQGWTGFTYNADVANTFHLNNEIVRRGAFVDAGNAVFGAAADRTAENMLNTLRQSGHGLALVQNQALQQQAAYNNHLTNHSEAILNILQESYNNPTAQAEYTAHIQAHIDLLNRGNNGQS